MTTKMPLPPWPSDPAPSAEIASLVERIREWLEGDWNTGDEPVAISWNGGRWNCRQLAVEIRVTDEKETRQYMARSNFQVLVFRDRQPLFYDEWDHWDAYHPSVDKE